VARITGHSATGAQPYDGFLVGNKYNVPADEEIRVNGRLRTFRRSEKNNK
jgi:hypothetical protein